VCVWSLRYPAFNVLAPFCHLWAIRLYNIFFQIISQTVRFSKNKRFLNIESVFWFSLKLLSEILFILNRTEQDMIKNVHWSSCKVPVILFRFKWNLNFFYKFSKNTQVPNFKKIDSVEAELFRADRRMDRRMDRRTDRHDEANRLFRSFAKEPTKNKNHCQ